VDFCHVDFCPGKFQRRLNFQSGHASPIVNASFASKDPARSSRIESRIIRNTSL